MRKWPVALAAVLLVLAGCASTSGPSDSAPLDVATTTATVHGVAAQNTRQFLGIRYAEPPVGDLRWSPPQPLPTSDDDADATAPGSQCPQSSAESGGTPTTDEDCLFLNVTTPLVTSNEPLPVMVWWHGGGFTSGAGSAYEAQRIASEGNVIVVTVNYRLGMLGYLGLPDLDGGGNFGFADQIQSLRWVNDNAAAFGGDPDNVTVFGESAGGMAACAALTSPAAQGLVDKVAIMSGSCALNFPTDSIYPGVPEQRPYVALADNEATGAEVAKQLGCSGSGAIECLRALPVDALVAQGQNFSNRLAYGTELLPADPARAVEAVAALDVPVFSGGNRAEQNSFVGGALLADPTSVTADSYPALLADAFGPEADRVADLYPLQNFSSAALAWASATTDAGWSCPTYRNNRALAVNAPVYSYEFADTGTADVSGVGASGVPQDAAHATDMPYFFDIAGHDLLKTPAQHDLARTMIAYLTSFAHTGTPSADNAPPWPRTTADVSPVLQFVSDDISVIDADAEHHCDFWNSLAR
ncbi:carboxylesterase/lipase family protein [Rhodococcus sp. 05-339-2]|uniref:carboxylesterase/lipase family protein n=1 Tax=Rhodococcoides fascians TaxID=1828 RepID=UPI00050CC47F|nr:MULTISPECIES: carboxylesterase family protein [Rhodococcus]OZD85529.1 carboxylesterase/lipase family protein [Rhodococcus sp. 05-339-2]